MGLIQDRPVKSFVIVGADYPGLRPALKVAVGDMVQAGLVLLTDRAHPLVVFVAPMAAKVNSVEYGPRRSLSAMALHREEEHAEPPDMTTRKSLRDVLLSRGMWTMFRTRPFGRFPDPERVPDAIFVTATDTKPLAPDPRVYLAGREHAFRSGAALLALLTDGPVYVCQSAGSPLVEESLPIRNVVFDGAHPAALASTHIEALHPLADGQQVWTVDCQDVAAIGDLAETGHFDPTRIVTVSGAHHPRRVSARSCGREWAPFLSSNPSGRDANWLGRFDRQISKVESDVLAQKPAWLRPHAKQRDLPRAIIPTPALKRALPSHFLPVPLMRALPVGDVETATQLGAMSLIEENMALTRFLCTSGADYGSLLRHVLNELEIAA